MRGLCLILCFAAAASAAVVSRDWGDGKLTLHLDDGTAELEWLSPVAFHFSRNWSDAVPRVGALAHEKITPTLIDVGSTITMSTKYLTVDLDRNDLKLHIHAGETPVTDATVVRDGDGAELRIALAAEERVFGLMGGTGPKLNLRGERLEREHGYFFTSAGYGILVRSPASCIFDMNRGAIEAHGADFLDFIFYYGPAAKEILEQYSSISPRNEVKGDSLDLLSPDRLPKGAAKLPASPVRSWDDFAALIRTIVNWSLSGLAYPAVDLSIFDGAPAAVRQRAEDLSTLLPIVYRSAGEGGIDRATRLEWAPYLITYLREAYDRGYPLIRPLPLEFSRDADSDRQADVFMLGDEVLVAPMAAPGTRRRVELPRGNWTDLRTNIEYPGRQVIEISAAPGRVPMFVRNGWIVPLAVKDRMELHYFPSLGAEFFLWEPELEDNSQFHAAPAGEFLRVEIESKRARTYEWVLHHTKMPREVAEQSGAYEEAARRELLRAGTWWHDAAKNNLHLMLRAEAGSDRIVNILL